MDKLTFNLDLQLHCKNNKFDVVYENIDRVTEEEYVKIRMDWIGASESSKLLNVNPFANGSCKDLIWEKVTNEVDESISKKASVRMGKDVEDIILHKLQDYLNCKYLDKPKDMYGNFENHLSCNFDAVMLLDNNLYIPIEIKTVTKYGRKYYDFNKSSYYQKDGEWQEPRQTSIYVVDRSDYSTIAEEYGIPVYYYTQLQQQMMILNSSYGYLAVMDSDNWDVHIFLIHANHLLWEDLKHSCRKAWLEIDTTRKIRQEKNKKDLD